MKWYITVQPRYGPGYTSSCHEENLEYVMAGIINAGLVITRFSRTAPDYPRVPSVEECAGEAYRARAMNAWDASHARIKEA